MSLIIYLYNGKEEKEGGCNGKKGRRRRMRVGGGGGEGGRGRGGEGGGGGGWMQREEWKEGEEREDATGRKVKVGG